MGLEDYSGGMFVDTSIFKSVYITGTSRRIEGTNEVEQIGKLQVHDTNIRNQDEICMIPMFAKRKLVKVRMDGMKEIVECFSYMKGEPPYKGTSGRTCPNTSAQRDATVDCKGCRQRIILAGLLVTPEGKPIKDKDGEPIFVFLRGKGIKFMEIADYISECAKLPESKLPSIREEVLKVKPNLIIKTKPEYEKPMLNFRRFICHVGVQQVETNFGTRYIYKLTRGKPLPTKVVIDLLLKTEELSEIFDAKFDLSLQQTYVDYEEDLTEAPPKFKEAPADQSTPFETEPQKPSQPETQTPSQPSSQPSSQPVQQPEQPKEEEDLFSDLIL